LNPLAQLVMLYRGILLDGFAVEPFMVWYPAAWAAGAFAAGLAYFARASRTFAKEL
jgi:ABC-type polysaccharide/polyol phosphate export permease